MLINPDVLHTSYQGLILLFEKGNTPFFAELDQKRPHKCCASSGLLDGNGVVHGLGELEELDEIVIHRKSAIIQSAIGGPWIRGVGKHSTHLRANGGISHHAHGPKGLQTIRILERFSKASLRHMAPAIAVIQDGVVHQSAILLCKPKLGEPCVGVVRREFAGFVAVGVVFGEIDVIVEKRRSHTDFGGDALFHKNHGPLGNAQEMTEVVRRVFGSLVLRFFPQGV